MKVISGTLKGRIIKGYNINGTRPTMDRVKESIFGTIQNHIKDSTILDLFAGSGNYGIETLSNYAKLAYFNDYNKEAIKVIKTNLQEFKLEDKSIVLNLDYKKCLNYLKDKKIKFDLVFLDPPYDLHVLDSILDYLSNNNLLNKNALVIVEYRKEELKDNYNSLKLIKNKKYGEKLVNIYRSDKDEDE